MPCYEPDCPSGPSGHTALYERTYHGLNAGQLNSILCGVLRAFGEEVVLKEVDWGRVGVSTVAFTRWWAKHQRADEIREQHEQQRTEQQRRKDLDEMRRLLAKYPDMAAQLRSGVDIAAPLGDVPLTPGAKFDD